MSIYHACDIRGIYGEELTPELARKIGRAAGYALTGKEVVVGGDVRLSTPVLKEALIAGLVESGCRVADIGIVATPVFYFALQWLAADGGIMVTASHNPAPYNGFKLAWGDRPVTEADIIALRERVEAGAFTPGKGSVIQRDVISVYFDFITARARNIQLPVVIDAGNGACGSIAPALFRKLGYTVHELYCDPDGRFPNRPPNPALAENLTALSRAVKQNRAFLGAGFDGDGDRVAFVDEQGGIIDNDKIIVLFARHYLAGQTGAIIYDAKCSMVVPEEIVRAGGTPVMARAGHTFAKAAFQEEKALFAGEISGHFFFRELGHDDGMFAALKLCEIVAAAGQPLSRLVADIPTYHLTPDIRVPYHGSDKEQILAQVAGNLAGYDINTIDGVRISFSDGWGMIRASVTEPLFTLRFEAKDQRRLKEIISILLGAVPAFLHPAIYAQMAAKGVEV